MRIARFALAAALTLTAAPALAAVHLSLSGVVTYGTDNGYDIPGLEAPFGSTPDETNADTGETFGYVVDRPFTLDIVIDTSKGVPETVFYGGDQFSNYLKGLDADNPSHATFTLGDITYAFGDPTDTYGTGILEKYRTTDSGEGLFAAVETFRGRPPMDGLFTTLYADLSVNIFVPPGTFQTWEFGEPLTLSQMALGFGNLNLDLQETSGTPDNEVLGRMRSAYLNLRIDSLSLTSDTAPAAVPEPATWAMMILGFAAVGATLRRRQPALV